MKNPLLTIITITKDDPDGMRNTLRSIEENDGSGMFEWIIVNGGDSEWSGSLMAAISAVNGKIYRRPARGISNAFNFGLSVASGDWVIFMNGGDAFIPGVLAKVFPVLINSHPTTIHYGDAWINRDQGVEVQSCSHTRSDQMGGLCHQSVFISRAVHRRFLFDERLKNAMDYDLWFRLRRDPVIVFQHLGFPVACYAVGGISSDLRFKERCVALHFMVAALNREPANWCGTIGRFFFSLLWIRIKLTGFRLLGASRYEKFKSAFRRRPRQQKLRGHYSSAPA